jgi:hypothetical protein
MRLLLFHVYPSVNEVDTGFAAVTVISMATSPPESLIMPVEDNFYTPENRGYCNQRGFVKLERTKICLQFRLLEIDPHQIFKSGKLRGKLLQSLGSNYSTISYFAGDPNDKRYR